MSYINFVRLGGDVRGGQNRKQRQVTIGHATHLQLSTPAQWRDLKEAMDDLHIHLVGLPQCDIDMVGKSSGGKLIGAPRGSLRVPRLWNERRWYQECVHSTGIFGSPLTLSPWRWSFPNSDPEGY
jgi:hypothetical protein